MKHNQQQSAFIVITSVLIIAAGLWLLIVGQAALQMNESLADQSWRGLMAVSLTADSCMEVAGRALVLNRFYSGQSLSLGANSCIIDIIRDNDNYQITVKARAGDYYKKIMVDGALVANHLTVNAWREADN